MIKAYSQGSIDHDSRKIITLICSLYMVEQQFSMSVTSVAQMAQMASSTDQIGVQIQDSCTSIQMS